MSMEVIKQYGSAVDYIDDEFVIAHSLNNISMYGVTFRVNILLFIECLEGRAQLEMNGKSYTLGPGEMLICLPTAIISQMMISPNNKIRMMGFSTTLLRGILRQEADVEKVFSYLYANPIQRARQQPSYAKNYSDLLEEKIEQSEHRFRKETIHFIVSALICEIVETILVFIDKEAPENRTAVPEPRGGYKRSSYVFKEFMRTLSEDNGMHRSVAYFADRLCYSPKYLSSVVRHVSGRTALDWINEYTIEQIKHRLKHSDKTIKEIAEELNFSNQSFFGKYVKTHLGMSPARYREKGN